MQNKKQKDKTLQCPRCWVAMEKEEVEVRGPNVIIDVCPKCHGVWFDNNELKKILGDRKLANFLTKHIGTQTGLPSLRLVNGLRICRRGRNRCLSKV
jgi:ribosomal protein L31